MRFRRLGVQYGAKLRVYTKIYLKIGKKAKNPKNIIYNGNGVCPRCGKNVETVSINDSTVIREFSANYWLIKNKCGHYDETGRFAVLCKYSDFINDPDRYIDAAFNKTKEEISNSVHFRDIDHRGKLGSN